MIQPILDEFDLSSDGLYILNASYFSSTTFHIFSYFGGGAGESGVPIIIDMEFDDPVSIEPAPTEVARGS